MSLATMLNAQNLSLTDMTKLLGKKNWIEADYFLTNKGWMYEKSENDGTSLSIDWSYNKYFESQMAEGWLTIDFYDNMPEKIFNVFFNPNYYNKLKKTIPELGFKFNNSEVLDEVEIMTQYENKNYILWISIEKTDFSEQSSYKISLIKKRGILDYSNGYKREYYPNNSIMAEYTLLNGNLHGKVTRYYPDGSVNEIENYNNGVQEGRYLHYDSNGKLQVEANFLNDQLHGLMKKYYPNGKLNIQGNYVNDKYNGQFIEYNEYGVIVSEILMKNDLMDGMAKFYNNGKISKIITYKNGVKNGPFTEYNYLDALPNKFFKIIGEYRDDEKYGLWNYFLVSDNTEYLTSFENYNNGQLNGQFLHSSGDSVIIGYFKNEILHGDYKIYFDVNRMLRGGYVNTDLTKLYLITQGKYIDGQKAGYWKYYDIFGGIIKEGAYMNDRQTGEWKYFHSTYVDDNGNEIPYSRQLYLVENYQNGILNGESIRHSYVSNERYPCPQEEIVKGIPDTCSHFLVKAIYEKINYLNGKKNGEYKHVDSTKTLVSKGTFINDIKEGEWTERYDYHSDGTRLSIEYHRGKYSNGFREGPWLRLTPNEDIIARINYKQGLLHGDYDEINKFNKVSITKFFQHGKLKRFTKYDQLGLKKEVSYEIFDENEVSYRCKMTQFLPDGAVAQDYWVKKSENINHFFFELNFLMAIKPQALERNGFKEGSYIVYNSNNDPIVSGNYQKDDRVGLWVFYNYEDDFMIHANYVSGERISEKYLTLSGAEYNGALTIRNEDVGLKEIIKLKNGLRHGATTIINMRTNKTEKKIVYKHGKLK